MNSNLMTVGFGTVCLGIFVLIADHGTKIKDSVLDTAAKATVSFEERQDKFRSSKD